MYICEFYALVRCSERPLAPKCDHMRVGAEGCSGTCGCCCCCWDSYLRRSLLSGNGWTEGRSPEAFRTESCRASPYTLTLSRFVSLPYSSGPKLGRDSGIPLSAFRGDTFHPFQVFSLWRSPGNLTTLGQTSLQDNVGPLGSFKFQRPSQRPFISSNHLFQALKIDYTPISCFLYRKRSILVCK